ncbi:MAG: SusC/RagA family TonB-linked outer membrane protein [Paludibacter sp.]|nr:SusC/RagA family TonB-linked outer membrane protein [Paludibacter sp.]
MKNIKIMLIALLSVFTVSMVVAQSAYVVQGSVIEASDKSPLPGVNVIIKGTNQGVVTDISGHFTIRITKQGKTTLVFSMVGYESKEVEVSQGTTLNITLNETSTMINEVVVTALGINRESKSLGYARQSVEVESMTQTRSANLTNMLAGKVAGVNVIAGASATGSTRIEIRGSKSLTGNNQPLFVVDGVIIQNDMGQQGDLDYGNIASNINPDDIESMEVLKGANAAALYGSDAANGVILITTKKAKISKELGVSYGLNMMWNTIYQYPEFQNIYGGGQSFRLGENNTYRDLTQPNVSLMLPYRGKSWGIPMIGTFKVKGRNGEMKWYEPNPNNVIDFYQTALQTTNNISISKSNEVSGFRFSYTNTSSTDVLKDANLRSRHNFSLRSNYTINKYIQADATVRYTIDNIKDRPYGGWSDRNPMRAYLFFPRDMSLSELIPWKDANGDALRYTTSDAGFINPYWSMYECWNADEKEWLLANLNVVFNINKELQFILRGSIDSQGSNGFDFTNKGSLWAPYGRYTNFSRNIDNYQYEGLLTYNKTFFNNYSVNANFGGSWRDNSMYQINASVDKLIVHNMASLANAAEAPNVRESLERSRRESLYGQVSLGYKSWLFFDVTGRNDWNSTLPVENASFFYPSVSGSFIVSDAFHLPENVFTFAKLRASWAKVGNGTGFNQLVNNFNQDILFNGVPLFTVGTKLKNPYLRPETTYSTEVGADIRLFKSRISIDASYYFTRSIDQIVSAKVSTSTGFTDRMYNTGEIQNKGVEIALTARPIQVKNIFSWDVALNWAHNKNLVVSIMDGVSSLQLGGWGSVTINAEEGHPYGVIRGTDVRRDADGVQMIGMDGRPISTNNQYLGNIQPKFTGSLANNFRLKNFDINVMMDFKYGGMLFSASDYTGVDQGNSLRSLQFRDEYSFSYLVLKEDANELNGINTITGLPYSDTERVKGGIFPGRLYALNTETGEYEYRGENTQYLSAQTYWEQASRRTGAFLYDASFIKIREVSIGYKLPTKMLLNTPVKSINIAFVARNLWTLYQNTPFGIDPQATASTGNDQGIESAFALPAAYYGFDFKISF